MFTWWGAVMSRFRWPVLAGAVVFTAFASIWGTGVFGQLSGSGFNQPGSESERTAKRIEKEIGWRGPDILAVYSSKKYTVTDPEFRDPVVAATDRLKKRDDVDEVRTFYDNKMPNLVSKDEHATYVAITVPKEAGNETFWEIRDDLQAKGLTTRVGGSWAISMDVSDRAASDIARAEMISMPILLVLLVLVFGSLVAATTPLLIGSLAIIGAFTVVRLLTYVTDVSSFSINVITILGLGLAIDYALFVVSRFREELDRAEAAARQWVTSKSGEWSAPSEEQASPVELAVARTMATAGRTVAVSGLTVALALSGLLIFPQTFLRSMGLGGIAAVIVAVMVSMTVLPALLAVLGNRIDAVRLPWVQPRKLKPPSSEDEAASDDNGTWAKIARSVMRRPALYAIGVTVLLLLLAVPFTRVQFGGMDERVLPEGTESRIVAESIRDDFRTGVVNPITVVVSGSSEIQALAFAKRIEKLDGVREAIPTARKGRSSVITVSYDGSTSSETARGVVRGIRELPVPPGAEALVGGSTAELVDLLDGIEERLPWMALLVAGVTFVLLFLAFGSVVLPLKAIAMNVLSLGASFGAVVWVFQDGHFSDTLNFTPMALEATQPILMLALLFGLSMDYEVFLLSRVREQWDNLGDNTAAVANGVQRTGGIITAAALLLAVVVAAFATSGVTFIKMIGLGMLVALIVDATLVRLLLVPATMRLMGRYNWWAPSLLRKVYDKYGIRESEEPRKTTSVSSPTMDLPSLADLPTLPSWMPKAPSGRRRKPAIVVAMAALLIFFSFSAAAFVWSVVRESTTVAEYRAELTQAPRHGDSAPGHDGEPSKRQPRKKPGPGKGNPDPDPGREWNPPGMGDPMPMPNDN